MKLDLLVITNGERTGYKIKHVHCLERRFTV